MTGELRALTGARGLAAWLVVLYHIRLSIAGLPPGLLAVFAKGYLAVDFFFLLSGFVIWLTWSARLRDGGRVSVSRFWWKRIARVLPLHLAMLALAVMLATLLAVTGRANSSAFPFAELPLHLLLLQNWGFTTTLAWNTPAWSISAEAAAYCLFPLLATAFDWRRLPTVVLLAAMLTPLALLHVVMTRAGAPTLGWEIPRFGMLRCLCEFTAGTAVAALWLRWRDAPGRPAIVAGGLGAIGITLAATDIVPETLATPAAFAALLLALSLSTGRRRHPLEGRVLHYLGEISYATYLSHWLLFFAFKLVLVTDPRAVPPGLIALYLVSVLVGSIALHHLVERPAQAWLNARPFLRRNDPAARALPRDAHENRLFG